MLKSTYKAPAHAPAPLLPGWTEHKAPTGQLYYHNAATNISTYTRPAADPASLAPFPIQPFPSLNLADPRAANAYIAQHNGHSQELGNGAGQRARPLSNRPRPQPTDKPRSSVAIPGCAPWMLVFTKLGRRFAYNSDKNASYWRIPDKLKAGVLELDQARIRQKAGIRDSKDDQVTAAAGGATPREEPAKIAQIQEESDSDGYEEVEVTDDEGVEDGAEGDEPGRKRQRVDDDGYEDVNEDDQAPVEFSEADIAQQLRAMGVEYGLDPGEYDDGNEEDWPEGAEGVATTAEEAEAIFRSLLDDLQINPYSPWEKLIEEGHIIEDPRYTMLSTTKVRKEVWEAWSRDKIKQVKEQRAKEEKADPGVTYMIFLQEKATPKLYWPEFKRKYRKEGPMKDLGVSDKDREKWYREHINRLKMPQMSLKADLSAMLRKVPLTELNGRTLVSQMPISVLTDVRYISLPADVRDPLVEAFIQTLPGPDEQ